MFILENGKGQNDEEEKIPKAKNSIREQEQKYIKIFDTLIDGHEWENKNVRNDTIKKKHGERNIAGKGI